MFTAATTTNHASAPSHAAPKTVSLPTKTAVGGVQTRPRRLTTRLTTIQRCRYTAVAQSVIVVAAGVAATAAKAPMLVTA